MSFLVYEEACDDMFAFFKAGWDTGSITVLSEIPQVFYQGVDAEKLPKDKPYTKIFLRHGDKPQVTLGTVGNRRFESFGVIIIEIYEPIQRRQGLDILRKLATVALDIFEGKKTESGIWFRNTRINESFVNGNMITVYSEFEYDSLK